MWYLISLQYEVEYLHFQSVRICMTQTYRKKISIQITSEAENVPSVISSLENVSDRYPQHGPFPAGSYTHRHTRTHTSSLL